MNRRNLLAIIGLAPLAAVPAVAAAEPAKKLMNWREDIQPGETFWGRAGDEIAQIVMAVRDKGGSVSIERWSDNASVVHIRPPVTPDGKTMVYSHVVNHPRVARTYYVTSAESRRIEREAKVRGDHVRFIPHEGSLGRMEITRAGHNGISDAYDIVSL